MAVYLRIIRKKRKAVRRLNRITNKILICAVAVFTLILTFAVMPSLSPAVTAAESDSGAVYEISEDGTYVIITGYAEDFPKIEIPSQLEGLPVTEIAKNAFTNNVSLYSIVIPDTVTTIGDDAFRNCRSLVSVSLPAGLKKLPMNCFFGCSVLKTIILPEGLETIGEFCFEGCTKLGMLKIPASVTEIGYDAFVHCENVFLDVSENEYAAAYAVEYNVNTDYKGTSQYFWTVIGVSVAVALVVFFIISMIYLGYLKKNPEKNPNIFIFRVLGRVYDALSKAISVITALIIKGLSYAIYGITTAIAWLKFKLGKNKKKPTADDPEIDERTE